VGDLSRNDVNILNIWIKKFRPVKLPCPNLMTASWRCYPEWYEERMKTKGETNENPDDCAYEK
ncbi:MAG TPA: hypothetical protein VEP90_24160, partial [Methylomirabilota bacterium]|nr:hypothetical protein [Methylomirabilota bacterium]